MIWHFSNAGFAFETVLAQKSIAKIQTTWWVIAIFKPQREHLSYMALSVRRFSSKKVSFSERNLKHGAIHTFDENKTHRNGAMGWIVIYTTRDP
jgi:hypothetical protein